MAENALTAAFFELHGRRRLLADGIMTLMEYSSERIIMLCRGTRVRIWGTDLQIALLSQNKAMITGLISGFEFF